MKAGNSKVMAKFHIGQIIRKVKKNILPIFLLDITFFALLIGLSSLANMILQPMIAAAIINSDKIFQIILVFGYTILYFLILLVLYTLFKFMVLRNLEGKPLLYRLKEITNFLYLNFKIFFTILIILLAIQVLLLIFLIADYVPYFSNLTLIIVIVIAYLYLNYKHVDFIKAKREPILRRIFSIFSIILIVADFIAIGLYLGIVICIGWLLRTIMEGRLTDYTSFLSNYQLAFNLITFFVIVFLISANKIYFYSSSK